ncbi:MAG: sugar transferase [Clostridia bacterium]|nr:sugar transferase [Clostridia bacterium]
MNPWLVVLLVFAGLFLVLCVVAMIKRPGSRYKDKPEEQNPMEGKMVRFVADESEKENADGVKGHLEAVGPSNHTPSFYERIVKRILDLILSFGGLVILSPVFAIISLWILIDDPGPILFKQKRIGKDKQYFALHKFRSMKMSTPHNVPTHMLENSEQYITRSGKFIRAHSLDELPQIWDIFIGNMSVIGPRPGLWNQDLLTAERDKYKANDIKPGLTGWAQINGRDELEIPVKAELDGEYTSHLSLYFDIKCFLGSLGVFVGDKSVVEGGTHGVHTTTPIAPNDGETVYKEDDYQVEKKK